MGVTYKLRDEVVQFIINQRQSDPFSSCRQLAESASERFGLRLSKSSVHDVLRESGISTPRGRKPKNKFEIPEEKKQQIQTSLSQVKLGPVHFPEVHRSVSPMTTPTDDITPAADKLNPAEPHFLQEVTPLKQDVQISGEYEGAGKVFLNAALWDLGVFSLEDIKEPDRAYYLTYAKGIKVTLEKPQDFFIDLPLPIERCIRETVDGLVNNIKPLMVSKVSNEELFRSCMKNEAKIVNISIVDQNDHEIAIFDDIVECNRRFIIENRLFVVSDDINMSQRAQRLFFDGDNIDNILKIKGFDAENTEEYMVTLFVDKNSDFKDLIQQAAEKVNKMYLRDKQNRLVKIHIQS